MSRGLAPRAFVVALVLVALALGAGAVTASAQGTVTTGPLLTPSSRSVEVGQRIQVVFTGWTARSATLSICGNQALRGSADCNMVESTGVRLRFVDESPVHDLTIVEPPASCPCVIRAVSTDTGETAAAPITIIGHPVEAVVAPADGPLLDIDVQAESAGDGAIEWTRSALGGPSPVAVTVRVRNTSAGPISDVAVHAAAGRSSTTELVSFDRRSGPIGPGETWTETVVVEVPAPAVGSYTWMATASGAGPIVAARAETTLVPWALILAVALFAGVVVAIVVRALSRRQARRRLALPPVAPDPAPVVDAGFLPDPDHERVDALV